MSREVHFGGVLGGYPYPLTTFIIQYYYDFAMVDITEKQEPLRKPEEVKGGVVIKKVEQAMGPTGLEVLGVHFNNFIFSREEEPSLAETLEQIDDLLFQVERLPAVIKTFESYSYKAPAKPDGSDGEVNLSLNYHGNTAKSTYWHGVRRDKTPSGNFDTWKLQTNYSMKDGVVQFTGGINSFKHGDTGIGVSNQAWFKHRAVEGEGEIAQPIAIFSVYKDDRMLHAITLPTTSLTFPYPETPIIPSPELLPPLEPPKGQP